MGSVRQRVRGDNSWDSSHLWHLHTSFYRTSEDEVGPLEDFASLLIEVAGGSIPEPASEPAAPLAQPGDPGFNAWDGASFNLAAGHCDGLASGRVSRRCARV